MKIVLVHNAYQELGGEDVVFESERRLLESAGHHVIPYVRSNWQLRNTTLLDRIAILPRMVWSSETRREFAALLDANSPELVHVHNTFMAISPSIYSACEERGIPVVQTLHNYRLLCPGSNFYRDGNICEECLEYGLHRSVRHGCYRNSRSATAGVALMLAVHDHLRTWSKHVTRFITLTEFARRKFVAAGFPREKFVVKPNFVDPDPGERVSPGDYAVFVGRLAADKGLLVLLNAWSQLQYQYPLQIVGDGPARESLEAQVRERQLSNITFRGRLSRSDAMETIKNGRFLIMPSTWFEAFGMCIAESYACGTPVLCSRLGAMEEIVTDGLTGLHFAPNNALDLASKVGWLWKHPREAAAMGRAARAKYESSYTPEHNYTLLMRIYEQALGQPTWQSRRETTLQPSIPRH
jgi:glycosyltransferase involved in cell wall biosynthesis